MTRALIVTAVLVVGVPAFFAWAYRANRRHYGRFTRRDVQAALERALGPELYQDDRDPFLAWPIDDQYLESVRQRCIEIWDEYGEERGEEFASRVRQVLDELKISQKHE